eukprot:scaffold52115_cov43-Prasinocladus_malaysianus.AAC.2
MLQIYLKKHHPEAAALAEAYRAAGLVQSIASLHVQADRKVKSIRQQVHAKRHDLTRARADAAGGPVYLASARKKLEGCMGYLNKAEDELRELEAGKMKEAFMTWRA